MKNYRKSLTALVLLVIFCFVTFVGCTDEKGDNSLTGTDLIFEGATHILDESLGSIYYVEVDNAKMVISFADYIKVSESSKWTVSIDIHGRNSIPSKTTDLEEGNNLFYVLVTDKDGHTKQHTVLIVRKTIIMPSMHTVTFKGFFEEYTYVTVQVKDGDLIEPPKTDPTKDRYIFKGWDYDFTQPVTHDLTIHSLWKEDGLLAIHISFRCVFLDEVIDQSLRTIYVKPGETLNSLFPSEEIETLQQEIIEGFGVSDAVLSNFIIRAYPKSESGYHVDPSLEKAVTGHYAVIEEYNQLYIVFEINELYSNLI